MASTWTALPESLPRSATPAHAPRPFGWGTLVLAIILYLSFAIWIARTKAPWCDEGWFACPAYNLATHGKMSTNVLEPSGHFLNAYLRGIQERTYIVVPNHMLALAAWFRLFGFSLITMRVYSILWGALTLLVFYYIVHRLVPDRKVAQLGVLLLALDFIFLWGTADGRMEAPASALALGSIAAYLHFREKAFGTAVILSQILGAAAIFTHPNAMFGVLATLVLAWKFDRAQLRWIHLVWAAAPYVVFALLWSIYIVQSPSDFAAQFFSNAAGRGSARWKIIIQPWQALWFELLRHAGTYMVSGLWPAVMNQAMIFVPIGYICALVWFVRHHRHSGGRMRMFLYCALTYLFAMTFLNGFKAAPYMLYLVPFYDAILAAWILHLWKGTSDRKLVAISLLAAFLALQLTTTVQHIRAAEYDRDYLAAIRTLKHYRAEGKTIVGTAALGFGMGFEGFRDDARLGIYSGLHPDVFVIDRSYRHFASLFETEEPGVFSYVVDTLAFKYQLVEADGCFWIFQRIPSNQRIHTTGINIQAMNLQKKGKKAEYFFEQFLNSAKVNGKAIL